MARTAFHASFLLAMPFLKDLPKEKKKKEKQLPKKNKKHSSEVEEVEEIQESVQEKPFSDQMTVGKPTAFVHVEYTIIPEILIYDFDVVCFGDVAKIYTRDYNTAVKTTVKGNVAWIAFTIDHHIHMSDELLEELHGTTVAFNVWHDKKKQFRTTQMDKPKKFAMLEEDIDRAKAGRLNTMFVPLNEYDTNGNIVDTTVKMPSLSVLVNNSLRAVPYPIHRRSIEALVKQHSDSLQIIKTEREGEGKKNIKQEEDKDTELTEDSEQNEETDTKGKRAKTGKKSPLAGSEQVTMLGELFFANITDTKTEKKFETIAIPYMAVIFTVCNLFIEEQLNYLNPAVVQIRDINNLPVKLFKKYGFEWIFMTYTLPNDKEYVTSRKRVDKVVSFNETRVMLTHDIDATSVMEFILTKFLRIQLWGVRDQRYCQPPVPTELFRLTESNRCMASRLHPDPFSHPHSKTDSEAVRFVQDKMSPTVCLAEMEMDISALAMNQLLVESINNFRRPRSGPEYGSSSGSWAYYNLPDVHEPGRVEPVNSSPFTDFMLQTMTVDVAFKTLAPLTSVMMGVYKSKEHYNRIIIVISGSLESQLCTDIIEEIYKTNRPYVRVLKPPNDLFYARREFLRPHMGEYSEQVTEELRGKQHFYLSRRGMFHTPVYHRSALTGFILDNGDRVLIVLEGRAQSSLLKMYCYLEELDVVSGLIVHYNSDMAFKTRLYHDFLDMGGFMVITMDEPVEVKQMRKQFLLTRSTGAPSRAVQTINKLNNLFSVKDIATACRQDFFPSAMHLASFTTEFGIPFRLIDDYTEAPTPLNECLLPIIIEEDTISIIKESGSESSPSRQPSDTDSVGFNPINTQVNYPDMSSQLPPGGFTLVHACSSVYESMMSRETIISEMGIPAVNALASELTKNLITPEDVSLSANKTPVSGEMMSKPSRKAEESPDSDAKKQTEESKSRNIKPVNKQDGGSKPKSVPVASSFSKKLSKAPKANEFPPIISVSPLDQPDELKPHINFPSLLLPRKRLQGTFSNNSSAHTVDFTKSEPQQENQPIHVQYKTPKTPPEPPCPLQEKYFRDFLSGTTVTPEQNRETKARRMPPKPPKPSKPQDRHKEGVHKLMNKTLKVHTKAPVRKKIIEPQVKASPESARTFPDNMFQDESESGMSTFTNLPMKHKKRRPRRSLHKQPSLSDPECPLQEYFKDYYESITSQR